MKYKVTYQVVNYEEVFTAGPYNSYEEAVYQENDIAGFEGVYKTKILPAENEESK